MRRLSFRFAAVLAILPAIGWPAGAEPKHGIAMHGEPALAADFDHLPYANPDAPKGGAINYAWPGTFDSVNPFIVQGSGARGSVDLIFGNNVFDTLMKGRPNGMPAWSGRIPDEQAWQLVTYVRSLSDLEPKSATPPRTDAIEEKSFAPPPPSRNP